MNYSKIQDPRQWAKWQSAGAIGTAPSTERVCVNLIPVIASLERLANDYDFVQQAGNPFTEFGHAIPENFPADYVAVAASAAQAMETHPKRHLLVERFSHEKVKRGYELLRSGTVPVWRMLPPSPSYN